LDPNAIFKLAFDKLRIRDLTCADEVMEEIDIKSASMTGVSGASSAACRPLLERRHGRSGRPH